MQVKCTISQFNNAYITQKIINRDTITDNEIMFLTLSFKINFAE